MDQDCVEVNLEKGLLTEILLTMGKWKHFQVLDYEQIPFKCKFFMSMEILRGIVRKSSSKPCRNPNMDKMNKPISGKLKKMAEVKKGKWILENAK